MNKYPFIIIPENFENASVFEKMDIALQLLCSLIYVSGKIIIHIIKKISEIRVTNDQNCMQIQRIQNQINQLNKIVESLRVRIAWTMDYVQLKKPQDREILDEFRRKLENQFDQSDDDDDEQDQNPPNNPNT